MCLKVVASNLLLISKAWESTLPWLPKQWCCARDGRPELELGCGCCENILFSQVLGATFMMNQLVVFDIQSLVCTPQMGKKWRKNRKSCLGDLLTPKVFSTWIGAKPMSQLCAEAKATRKTTARQVANVAKSETWSLVAFSIGQSLRTSGTRVARLNFEHIVLLHAMIRHVPVMYVPGGIRCRNSICSCIFASDSARSLHCG